MSDEPPADPAAATPATRSEPEPPPRTSPVRRPGLSRAPGTSRSTTPRPRRWPGPGRLPRPRGCGRGCKPIRRRRPRTCPSRRAVEGRPRPQAARRPAGPVPGRARVAGRRRRGLGHGPVARDRRPRGRPALRAGRLREGVLTVRADSTAWATQIRLLTSSILRPARRRRSARARSAELRVVGPGAPSWSRGPRRVAGRPRAPRHLRLSGSPAVAGREGPDGVGVTVA